MSEPIDSLANDRAARDEALGALTGHAQQIKTGLEEKSIGERLAEHAASKARSAGQEALDVARDSKGVIAGTAAALALWLFRKPIEQQARKLLPRAVDAWHQISTRVNARFNGGEPKS
jgi:hypothetical protein